jgi:hypothetical protein
MATKVNHLRDASVNRALGEKPADQEAPDGFDNIRTYTGVCETAGQGASNTFRKLRYGKSAGD